jgi:hypothetical protein
MMVLTRASLYRFLWVSLLFVAFCIIIMPGSRLNAASQKDPVVFFHQALTEVYTGTVTAPDVSVSRIAESEVFSILKRNVNSRLLRSIQNVSGSEMALLSPGDQTRRHAAILVVEYPDAVRAQQMKSLLAVKVGYFRKTKILTSYSSVVAGDLLIISYTESSGDARMAALIKDIPQKFTLATEAGTLWQIMPRFAKPQD